MNETPGSLSFAKLVIMSSAAAKSFGRVPRSIHSFTEALLIWSRAPETTLPPPPSYPAWRDKSGGRVISSRQVG